MKSTVWILAGACALALGCGDINIPDLNNPSLESLAQRPTRSGVTAAATGLLIGNRAYIAPPNGFVAMLGILGREGYNFDRADPRFVSEMLEAPELDPGSPAFGGNFWNQPYANIRNANIVLTALDGVTGVTDSEKKAIRGFTKTIQGLDFLAIAVTRWATQSGPVDVDRGLDQPLAPIVSKDEVLTHVAALLDEGKTELAGLTGAADVFPFPLSSGFAGFDKPSTFIQFNRALKARVEVYRQQWPSALTAIGESFIDESGSLAGGVSHVYGSGSGDLLNGLTSPNLFAHPRMVSEAEMGDTRVAAKIEAHPGGATTVRGITSDRAYTMYPTGTSPVPIIRNEELILLRAEARFHVADNDAEAFADVNRIRTAAGLPTVTLDRTTFIDELLKQRRYSLAWEGGHRWIDLRRYNKLDDSLKDLPAHVVHVAYPIPLAETDARQQ